jgi:hypothetical protein
MSGERRAGERGRWASQLRRVALVAVLAITSSVLLPLVHGGASHLGDCGVCSAIAHDGASSADVVSVPDLPPVATGSDFQVREPEAVPPRRDFDRCSARAPPATSVAI